MNNDEYLSNLIKVSQDLTRQLAEVQARILAHENRLDGEFVEPLPDTLENVDRSRFLLAAENQRTYPFAASA